MHIIAQEHVERAHTEGVTRATSVRHGASAALATGAHVMFCRGPNFGRERAAVLAHLDAHVCAHTDYRFSNSAQSLQSNYTSIILM